MIISIWHWLTTAAHWQGTQTTVGIEHALVDHINYSLLAVLIALVLGLPVGLLIGHTGKGVLAVAGVANALRALPTLGLLVFLYIELAPHIHGRSDLVYILPLEIVLVLLALPPIITSAYAGVQATPPEARDAAEAMGMRGRQVLLRVELPCSLPLVISGVRSATLQNIATATVGAYISLGGFGRYIIDGQAQHDYVQMASGAVLVAVLALLADGVLALIQAFVVSPGLHAATRPSLTVRLARRLRHA